MATQMTAARRGVATDEMKQVAKDEDVSLEWLIPKIARGSIIIPSNNSRPQKIHNVGIGKGLKTKVNVNIGTSTLNVNLEEEIEKARVAVKYHADTIMDLSDGGDIKKIRQTLLDVAPITFGTVPIYEAYNYGVEVHKNPLNLTEDDYLNAFENNVKDGVDYTTIHCGITKDIAKQFTYNSIKKARKLGMGIAITDIQEYDEINAELSGAINQFVKIKNIYKNIPECQTNFVYSKQEPKSTKDILGISGRIVKTGSHVIVAGNLTYGGSKHVATALLTMSKRFPQIRSAINLKYQNITILKIKKSKLIVSSYDRSQEPKNVKLKSSTIEWGIESAIKNSKKVLDVVYHKGDFGKEPMIIVFGETPNNILKKILKII